MNKWDDMQKQMGSVRKKVEILRKNQKAEMLETKKHW